MNEDKEKVVEETTNGTNETKEEIKTDFSEEEAKIASENVGKLLQLMDKYKPLRERRIDKFNKLKEDYEKLPENSYKRKQIAMKMLELSKKINPKTVWDSSKGTYTKEKKDE